MQKIQLGSPCKENNGNIGYGSPNKRKRQEFTNELIDFIKMKGLVLPPHLSKIINVQGNPESPLKSLNKNTKDTDKEDNDAKKLKIQLSECQFELKKMEEDLAEFKRQAKKEKEKDTKKAQETIKNLKNSLEYASEDNTYVVNKLKADHEEQINCLKEKHNLEMQQELQTLKVKYEIKVENETKLRKREVQQLKKSNQLELQNLKEEYQKKFDVINQRNSESVKEMSLRYKKKIDEKQKKYDSMRVALESERNTEQKMHEQTKIESKKEKEKLITQLCYLQNTKNQLQNDLEKREKKIKDLKSQINDLQVTLILKEEKQVKKINDLQNQYQEKYDSYQQIQKEKIKEIMLKHVNDLNSLQERMRQLQIIHKQKEELMLENIEDLSSNFECRPSKREDLSQIDQLKWALTKKEDEIRKLSRQLKTCNLQLQNKQDLYKRMFRGSSMSRDKKSREREDREQLLIDERLGKETVFRKSNTADIKYLLKFYHNPRQ